MNIIRKLFSPFSSGDEKKKEPLSDTLRDEKKPWPDTLLQQRIVKQSIPLKILSENADPTKPTWSMYYFPGAYFHELQVFLYFGNSDWHVIIQSTDESTSGASSSEDTEKLPYPQKIAFLFREIMTWFRDWKPGQIVHPQEEIIIHNSFLFAEFFASNRGPELQEEVDAEYEKVKQVLIKNGVKFSKE